MTSMLDGLHRAFTQQREFLANAAHELKTPVGHSEVHAAVAAAAATQLGGVPCRTWRKRSMTWRAWKSYCTPCCDWREPSSGPPGSLRRDLARSTWRMTCQVAIERLQRSREQRGVAIDFTPNGPIRLPADPDDLELVWSNLLENAIRFSPDRRNRADSVSAPTAAVAMSKSPTTVPAFRRQSCHASSSASIAATLHAPATPAAMALGLAISKALVEAYGGTIEPQSHPGEGTRMVVSLPMQSSRLTPSLTCSLRNKS